MLVLLQARNRPLPVICFCNSSPHPWNRIPEWRFAPINISSLLSSEGKEGRGPYYYLILNSLCVKQLTLISCGYFHNIISQGMKNVLYKIGQVDFSRRAGEVSPYHEMTLSKEAMSSMMLS